MVVGLLAGERLEVTAVTDGYAAERSLEENRPDLVLADVFMAGKNGYELCGFVKQDPRFSGVPVILLVGSLEPFDAAGAAKLGADGKLTKPIEPAGLVDMVRKFLGDCYSTPALEDPTLGALAARETLPETAGDLESV